MNPFLFIILIMLAMTTGCSDSEVMEKLLAEKKLIDEEHPGPSVPIDYQLRQITEITNNMIVVLDDHEQFLIEGVNCPKPAQEAKKLVKLLVDRKAPVVVVKSGQNSEYPNSAYIWFAVRDQEGQKIHEGPDVFSSVNELLVFVGQCEPTKLGSHEYGARYRALTELANKIH